MSALPNTQSPIRNKGIASLPAQESPAPQLDRYGRDPSAAAELLRRQTNYDADSGYAPFYAAWLADLPRITSGNVCTLFILTVGVLSLGRPDNPKGKRHSWTKPVTVELLAELCRCHVRDIQRQIANLTERKVIAVQTAARGTYRISLLYRDWQALPNYQPARLVAIDEPEEDAGEDQDSAAPAKDAVRLVKRPLKVNAGKTGRSIAVTVGVRTLRWQNSASLPLVYDAIVQGGELVVSTRLASDWRDLVKDEAKANTQRHGCRDEKPGVSDRDAAAADPRAAHVVSIFDPLLERAGGRLLLGDPSATLAACRAMGEMPAEYLSNWLHTSGKNPRASRPISGARVVPSIVKEAYHSWRKSGASRGARRGAAAQSCAWCGHPRRNSLGLCGSCGRHPELARRMREEATAKGAPAPEI
jgi:hypothetical protein